MIASEPIAITPADGNAPATTSETPTAGASLLGASTPAPATPAATPAPASGSSSAWSLNEKGEFSEGWLDRLGEEFKDSKQILGQFKDPAAMAKTLVNQQRLLGKKANSVLIPGEDASPEEIAEFRSKLGVPDSAESYAIKPSKLPDGLSWNENDARAINEIAHQNGVPPKAMEAILQKYAELEAGRASLAAETSKKELEAGFKTLKAAWGDKFENERSVAQRAVHYVGGNPDSPGFRDPEVAIVINKLAKLTEEDRMVTSSSAPTSKVGSARAHDIQTNPSNPLYSKYWAGDKETNELVISLRKNN